MRSTVLLALALLFAAPGCKGMLTPATCRALQDAAGEISEVECDGDECEQKAITYTQVGGILCVVAGSTIDQQGDEP